jgi:hypothetical protein
MTVTNYFPRKEDLVFDRAETVLGHLAEVVAARGEHIAAVRGQRYPLRAASQIGHGGMRR